jgi:regulator of protease activity HflC (stomatin/prohibitin superfamily)
MKERSFSPLSGYGMLAASLLALAFGIVMAINKNPFVAVPLFIFFAFTLRGFVIINPNEAQVLTLFGVYKGTLKANGFHWVNPFFIREFVSLRARNMNGQVIKVNDKVGNPIEIAAVIVWQVEETSKAIFEVNDYTQYVNIQSEAAVRHLAGTCPYDNFEDHSEVTLRAGAEQVNEMLETELTERLAPAGIKILEARISHLAYAQEIAHAMLQRQQATAVVSARKQIVEGAVGMVEMALAKLSERDIVTLDEERKAAMVSNLLVVLCGDKSVTPVVNSGTLHH